MQEKYLKIEKQIFALCESPFNLKQFREIQVERRSLEQEQLKQLCLIAASHPERIENITPEGFGFVCYPREILTRAA